MELTTLTTMCPIPYVAVARVQQELSIPDTITTTVYHFGFSKLLDSFTHMRTDQLMVSSPRGLSRLAFDSNRNAEAPARYSLPQDLVKIMGEQRAVQALKPHGERIFIGGEIEVHHLSEDGFEVYTFHRFEDYDRDETAIYDNYRASQTQET